MCMLAGSTRTGFKSARGENVFTIPHLADFLGIFAEIG